MIGIQTLRYTTLYFVFKVWHWFLNLGPRALRPVIITGALLLSVVMGLLVVEGIFPEEMLLAALIAPAGLLILYKLGRYEYGIVLILVSAGVIRFAIPATQWSVIVTSLMVTIGLVGIWLLQMLLHDQKIYIKPAPINKPLLTFVVVSIVAYLWGNVFRDPLVVIWSSFPIVQLAALTVNILLPILALFVSNKIHELKWIKWLVGIMIGLGALAAIGRLFGLYILIHDPGRGGILAIHDRGLFNAWVAALAYAMALFNEKLSWLKRALLLLLVGAWVYYSFILATSWVSGWLPMAIACVVITYVRSKRLFLLAAVGGLIYVAVNFNFYWENIVMAEQEEGSGTGRLELWERNLGHIVKHPFFGMGPAGYAVYNMSYHPDDARSTHNNYFDITAQTGVIGLGVFLWMFITFIHTAVQLRRALAQRRDFEEAFANAAQGGAIAAMAAMMLGDWVLPFAYNEGIAGFDNASYTWLFLGCLLSLYHIAKAREDIKTT
jgi:O-antigen ligase